MVLHSGAYTDMSLKSHKKDHVDTLGLSGTHSAERNAKYKKLETWLCSLLPLAVNFPLTQVVPHRFEEGSEYLVRHPRSHSRIYEKCHMGAKFGRTD